jgi:act minimal PKS acyl carrier protein
MSIPQLTIDDLRHILHECAGTDENVDLAGEVLDVEFEVLGYDSLALLETAATITREYGIVLDDDATTAARTPRDLLQLVNGG